MMDNWGVSSGNWIGMTLFMVIGILIIILMALIVARGTLNGSGKRNEDAMAVLRRRFAAGEIDEAEFRQRRETIGL